MVDLLTRRAPERICLFDQMLSLRTFFFRKSVTTNLTPGDASNGNGALSSLVVHDVDKSQNLTLRHAVTSGFEQEVSDVDHNVVLEMALHAELASEGQVVSNEQMLSSTSLSLALVVSEELVMDVKGSINSFSILRVPRIC
ncbi:hypothetical protein Nepgr_007946 [Nepenthes gracilis]|uniref:Uncharacterized protein n=1 Tax=Nepenthes gracilis TaxID=150966 RepID=A0AAD3XJ00_NEPGR|nr:hypothetical protein Nepgr_007946 [Nepenthes gracilis]